MAIISCGSLATKIGFTAVWTEPKTGNFLLKWAMKCLQITSKPILMNCKCLKYYGNMLHNVYFCLSDFKFQISAEVSGEVACVLLRDDNCSWQWSSSQIITPFLNRRQPLKLINAMNHIQNKCMKNTWSGMDYQNLNFSLNKTFFHAKLFLSFSRILATCRLHAP